MRKALWVAFFGTIVVAGASVIAGGQDAAAVRGQLAKVSDHSMPISKHWTLEQVMAMNHDSIMTLWKTLPAPTMAEMTGHMLGLVPNAGDEKQQTSSNKFMFDETSRNGYWLGKTFHQTAANTGEGYNIWRQPQGKIVRNLRVATEVGSIPDRRQALVPDQLRRLQRR